MRSRKRSQAEWMNIITTCRQSGLSNATWCEQNGISASAFYNAVSRLRKKACEIPEPIQTFDVVNLTNSKQDVVEIAITPDIIPSKTLPSQEMSSMHLDNSHTIEIEADGLLIRMSNEIKPLLLKMLMDTLKESLC